MTLHINSCTLTGFDNGSGTCFFGNNAHKVAEVLNRGIEKTCRGAEYILIPQSQQAVVFPKLVKAGYKIAIIDA